MSDSSLPRSTPLWLLLGVPVVAVVIAMAALWVALVKGPSDAVQQERTDLLLRLTGLATPVSNSLDARFSDADGDLLADTPGDAARQLRPARVVMSYVASPESEVFRAAFAGLAGHLSKATGLEVEFVTFDSAEDQLERLRDGSLHLTAFNTGNVPRAVNVAGFVPRIMLADDSGDARHRSVIIVPAKSAITSLQGLKGTEIWFTDTGSNSGYRYPLLQLRSAGLLPERDYLIRYSGGHESSIERLAAGEARAAAVASDVLEREVARGAIGGEGVGYRVLSRSEAFPSAALGTPHNLDPELAAKLESAALTYDWTGTALEKEFAVSGKRKFVKVDYKDDFALVRKIDDELGVKHVSPR